MADDWGIDPAGWSLYGDSGGGFSIDPSLYTGTLGMAPLDTSWLTGAASDGGSLGSAGLFGIPGLTPQSLLTTLLGGAAPLASLLGAISTGGQGPTGTSQTSGMTSGATNQQQTGTWGQTGNTSQIGTTNQTGTTSQTGSVMPQLLGPAAAAGGNAANLLNLMSPQASGLYGQGTSLLSTLVPQLLGGTSPAQQQVSAAITKLLGMQGPGPSSFPSISTTPSPELISMVKSAFEPYIGTLTDQAITSARNRGFAGGADLLGGPAAAIAGPALANVPGLEAQALMDMMVKLPTAQAQIAAEEAAANTNAYQAAIQAALGGGQLANTAAGQQGSLAPSLLQMLLNPMTTALQGNLALLTGYPTGSTSSQTGSSTGTGSTSQTGMNTVTGQSGSQATGTTAGTTSGQQSGSQQFPMGSIIGQRLAGVLGGLAQGYQAGQVSPFQQMLMDWMKSNLSGAKAPALA